ncbi:MAG: hypothetical protein IJ055_03050 [Oscillospiraceae bacterium]|nr:hypothetical protein [Oscillospiraceae bacterium]
MQFDKEYFDALNRSFDAECHKLEETELPEFMPSEQFTENMESLIHCKRKPYFKWIATSSRRVACIICALVVLSTITVTQVDAIRIPLHKEPLKKSL